MQVPQITCVPGVALHLYLFWSFCTALGGFDPRPVRKSHAHVPVHRSEVQIWQSPGRHFVDQRANRVAEFDFGWEIH